MWVILATVVAASASIAVIDGDTVRIDGETIRIANIDAPELHSPKCDAESRLARLAKLRLAEILDSGPIDVTIGDPQDGRRQDRHGRTLATLSVNDSDVGRLMIIEGLARPWRGKRQPWC